jgi:hypothetical protein
MEGLLAPIDHRPIASAITEARLSDNPIVAVNRAFLRAHRLREGGDRRPQLQDPGITSRPRGLRW